MGGRGSYSYSSSRNTIKVSDNGNTGIHADRASFTPEQYEMFKSYIEDKGGDGHNGPVAELRRWQNGEDLGKEKNAYYEKMDDLIEGFIVENAAPNGEIYRGIRISDKDLKRYSKIGAEFDQKGTSSWSSDKTDAQFFATRNDIGQPNSVLFVIKNSTKAADVSMLNSSEMELWQSKKQRFRTIETETSTFNGAKVNVIYLKEI